jgi:hypothetical protein
MPEGKGIAAGAGTSIGVRNLKAEAIEKAMADAVNQCAKEGITDPAEILKRKLAARDAIKSGKPQP